MVARVLRSNWLPSTTDGSDKGMHVMKLVGSATTLCCLSRYREILINILFI